MYFCIVAQKQLYFFVKKDNRAAKMLLCIISLHRINQIF